MFASIQFVISAAAFFLFSGIVALFAGKPNRQQQDTDWGYDDENGPSHWGELSPDFVLCCSGMSQSPIDVTGETAAKLGSIAFNYRPAPLCFISDEHNTIVRYQAGQLCHQEDTYNAVQFHFHHPGEHTIHGEAFPMELHIVHKHTETGALAVVAVMMTEGDPNAAFDTVFTHLPGEHAPPANITVNVSDLLPADTTNFYTYSGSLTTPPCSENVRWFVLAKPVTLSAEQIAAFDAIYHNNSRPVQPLNTRKILRSDG